jgi:hypothetical protein
MDPGHTLLRSAAREKVPRVAIENAVSAASAESEVVR